MLAGASTPAVSTDLASSPVQTKPNKANCDTLFARVPSVQLPRPAGQYIATKGHAMIVEQPEATLELAVPEAEIEGLIADPATSAPTSDDDNAIPTKWICKASNKQISAAIEAPPNDTCLYCRYQCTSRKRLFIHARLHWGHNFCPCSYTWRWRETVKKQRLIPRTSANTRSYMKSTGLPMATGRKCWMST